MKHPHSPTCPKVRRLLKRRGFALVVTLTLMILLTVIAVGLLTLSTISLRASSQSSDLATARSNAKLAMILALGELQKSAGADTRVTARADIIDKNNPPVLGVWKSWEGTDHNDKGQPIKPAYANHKEARFLQWLTSDSMQNGLSNVPSTLAGTDKVLLLGEGSVGKDDAAKRQVSMTPTKVRNALNTFSGSLAWWVSGENQKARLPEPFAPVNDSAASWASVGKSHSVADPKPFGLDVVLASSDLNDPTAITDVSKVTSLNQTDHLKAAGSTDKVSQEFYHDLSANSVGLLTNTATGGWRKDLSLFSEGGTAAGSSRLPMFRVTPQKDLLYNRPANGLTANSLLYHWSNFRANPGGANPGIYQFPAIGSWTNLVNYATYYQKMNVASSSAAMSADSTAIKIDGPPDEFANTVRILPVIARIQWLYSHQSKKYEPKAGEPTSPPKYTLQLLIQPVVTLWNPYNVTIRTSSLEFNLNGTLPPLIDYKINGASLGKRLTLQSGNATGGASAYAYTNGSTYRITNQFSLAPGETRVFSAATTTTTADSPNIQLVPGFQLGKGILADLSTSLTAPPSSYAKAFTGGSKITTDVEFTSDFNDANAIGVGLYLDMKLNGLTVLAYRMIYEKAAIGQVYKKMVEGDFPSKTFEEVEGSAGASPFLCVTFGARMASNTHLPAKGFIQSSPFVNYTAMGGKSRVEPTISYDYPGTMNNVNSPFEFSFQNLTANSPFIPNVANTHGFIVTGFNSGNGLTRCVISEIPGRPLNSLTELQNWDARFENPIPPYSYYLIGNSDASPLFPPDAAYNSTEMSRKGAENLQHDDSYCLNHMLFDDWFFSSIAPEPANFGRASSSSSVSTVYKDFLQDPAKPLMNRAYRPIAADLGTGTSSTTDLNALVTANVGNRAKNWKTIASRLEVEGMFNVNSTSVAAWRALLGHARDQKIPYMGDTGAPKLSSPTDYGFSRFSVAGDAGNSTGKAGEYAGYRVFTAEQLDFLAEQIVEQVRLRGPFLSLSEFVNRQLSTNKDLALAGAVQTALNELAKGSSNPFSYIQENTSQGTPPASNIAVANPTGGASGYKFPEAAVGYNIYGLPGWTRQADILKGIAPILSARDDTFTIRAYGDARDTTGKLIRARAVCEATIRRTADFVDATDDGVESTLSATSGSVAAKKDVNERFGRRFEIVSFRWLAQDEI